MTRRTTEPATACRLSAWGCVPILGFRRRILQRLGARPREYRRAQLANFGCGGHHECWEGEGAGSAPLSGVSGFVAAPGLVDRACDGEQAERYGIVSGMTKLLNQVMRQVAELPADRQDDAAHVLLMLLEGDPATCRLTTAQLREVDAAIADADDGVFASDDYIDRALNQAWV